MDAQYFSKYYVSEKSVQVDKENIDLWLDRYQNILEYYQGRAGGEKEIEIKELEPDKVKHPIYVNRKLLQNQSASSKS